MTMTTKTYEVILPKFGRMQEATLVEWLKKVGDPVEEEEPLFAIETDKANQEVKSEATGKLIEIRVAAGNVAQVGDVVGLLEIEEGARRSTRPASPSEVQTAAEQIPGLIAETIPLEGMRRVIAERMVESLRESAQLTLTREVDVTETAKRRDPEISPTAIVVQTVVRALANHRLLNSSIEGETIRVWDQVHVGVAVALEGGGLVVPVVREVADKDVRELSAEIAELARRAEIGQLTQDEVTGGTFTVTNLGMYGVDAFTPILNPPEVAILGVGRWVEKPAVHEGKVVIRTMGMLSLTVDHRVVDGAPAAAFLKDVAERLEQGNYS
jgi:pyruvate/2-oxoglutarate dehydrogenase complex dihydrolipoamide acyltransferase (E2) component